MMRLRVLEQSIWTVVAICDSRGVCQIHSLLDNLERDSLADYEQLASLLVRTAASGPPRDEKRSRALADGIYELKTRGGIRVPYFYDQGPVVICTEAMRKPKKTELRAVMARALAERRRYFAAKRSATLEFIGEEP
jgi:hypothetical protein